jgi:hypothetical protein
VLAPLARALRLTDDERGHLYRVAGQLEPSAGAIPRHLTPGVQRILDRLADVPVAVFDAAWELIAANPLATALLGDWSGLAERGRERNIVWRKFAGQGSRFVHTPEEDALLEAELVADLHGALGRYPDEERLRSLIDDLIAASPRFADLWRERPVGVRAASRKTLRHPEVGLITLDCDVLTVRDSDVRIVVYTAPPGSADADALALLGAVGLQSFR